MAEEPNSVTGGMTRQPGDGFTDPADYTYARNAINGAASGDAGDKLNEPANYKLIQAPYQIISCIYQHDDTWMVFSTDNTSSEIGLFDDRQGLYATLVNDPGLNFNQANLITGESKMNFDCTWSTYWADNHRNPDRLMNSSRIPYTGTYSINSNGCRVFTPDTPLKLDTDLIKLNPPTRMPCIEARKGASGGNLLNGTYYGVAAYCRNGDRVTSYSNASKAISLFSHQNLSGSLDFQLGNLDPTYDQYEFVVIGFVNGQATARRFGVFSITQTTIVVDSVPETLKEVPLEFIPIVNPIMNSSTQMLQFANRLMRIGPRSKFDFNYQPLANQINATFVVVEYPQEYYRNGGKNMSLLRDEIYNPCIRWVYQDGDKSPCFDIPGRGPMTGEDAAETGIFDNTYSFENVNTATLTNLAVVPLTDGGYQIAEGITGYWETEERYPTDKPDVWGNLCGKKIRHHKMPERSCSGRTLDLFSDVADSPILGPVIRVLAMKFYNIRAPRDNHGALIPGIVGYEILVSSREGNKTILAKGIINNTFNYALQDGSGLKGVYPNYPFNSLDPDPFVSSTLGATVALTGAVIDITPNTDFNKDLVTFHSPDTGFRHHFLSAQEIKVDGIATGESKTKFYEPQEHPKHKLPTNAAFFIASIVGIGLGVAKLVGQRNQSVASNIIPGGSAASLVGLGLLTISAITLLSSNISDDDSITNVRSDQGDIVEARDMTVTPLEQSERKNLSTGALSGAFGGGGKITDLVGGIGNSIGKFLRGALMGGLSLFVQFWSEGINTTMETIMNLSQFQQYALQQISHCYYNSFFNTVPHRFKIEQSSYLGSGFQDFANTRVNNLFRSSSVIVKTEIPMTVPTDDEVLAIDNSKQTLTTIATGFSGAAASIHQDPTAFTILTTASSYYASLKERLRNQYGQPGSAKKLPTGCTQYVQIDATNFVFDSEVIFLGDVYISRYTEKNTMYFFNDWLYRQFDGYEFNYIKAKMLQFPAYWANTKHFDVGDFTKGVANNLGGSISALTGSLSGNTQLTNYKTTPWLPTGFRVLDRAPSATDVFINNPLRHQSYFVVKDGYFYLFASGVRDFWVESEINCGYRDWEEEIQKRHYDYREFTDMTAMFRADPNVIKSDNYYKYDFSLSANRSFLNMISWGYVQPPYYNPVLAETCFVYHPRRAIYSLPQQTTSVQDAWTAFLANNQREFKSVITAIKALGPTGALVLFESDVPVIIQGSEQLQLSVTSVTIGEGSFLSREAQLLTNAERGYQYGATKERTSAANTPQGVFWVSPSQLRIFTISNGLMDIAMPEMIWWFSVYMPLNLLVDFPNYPHTSNPVMGIGFQTIYDGENGILYFCKKDYKFKQGSVVLEPGGSIEYVSGRRFIVLVPDEGGASMGGYSIYLDQTEYFEDASWTISYDVREKKWLSNHDWHPDLVMPSTKNFNTIKAGGIWRHNNRCDLFCNYYDQDYPFEIEDMYDSRGSEEILKSIEYYLEVYHYDSNCYDRYLFLNENFDELVVYNNEQVSGRLKLTYQDPDDPWQGQQFPQDMPDHVKILYARVENRYRIDMFSDLTLNRISNAYRPPILTEANGYIRSVNQANVDYNKDEFQRKVFRGYVAYMWFKKNVCGNMRFVVIATKSKTSPSLR